MNQEAQNPLWDHREINVRDEILTPLVDPEKAETVSLAHLRDPLLETVTTLEGPDQTADKMARQSLHQRGRNGAVRKGRLMKQPSANSPRMSPEQRRVTNQAVNLELTSAGLVFNGTTAMEEIIDPAEPVVATDLSYDPSRHNPMSENRSVLENETEIKLAHSRNPITTVQEPEDSLDDDVLDIFREEQKKVEAIGFSVVYHLLDSRFPTRNNDAPADIIEEDYSEDSRP